MSIPFHHASLERLKILKFSGFRFQDHSICPPGKFRVPSEGHRVSSFERDSRPSVKFFQSDSTIRRISAYLEKAVFPLVTV